MYKLPHTPSKESLPRKRVALRALVPKGCGGCAVFSVDFADFSPKSLFVELNTPTGLCCFSPCFGSVSTECAIFSTGAVFRLRRPIYLYLSLLKKKERKKERLSGKTRIHGFGQLPKKESTGFTPIPPLIRGNPWNVFCKRINQLGAENSASTHPQVVLPPPSLGFGEKHA